MSKGSVENEKGDVPAPFFVSIIISFLLIINVFRWFFNSSIVNGLHSQNLFWGHQMSRMSNTNASKPASCSGSGARRLPYKL